MQAKLYTYYFTFFSKKFIYMHFQRLNDRQRNSVLSTNQSFNKPTDDSYIKNNGKVATPVINQKPKTVNINVEILPKGKPSNISERLKVNSSIPPLLNLQTSISASSHQSKVLSPLSPGQVLGDDNQSQFQQLPRNSSVNIYNHIQLKEVNVYTE